MLLMINHYATDEDDPNDGCLIMVRTIMIMIDVSLNLNVVVVVDHNHPNDDLISCFCWMIMIS